MIHCSPLMQFSSRLQEQQSSPDVLFASPCPPVSPGGHWRTWGRLTLIGMYDLASVFFPGSAPGSPPLSRAQPARLRGEEAVQEASWSDASTVWCCFCFLNCLCSSFPSLSSFVTLTPHLSHLAYLEVEQHKHKRRKVTEKKEAQERQRERERERESCISKLKN